MRTVVKLYPTRFWNMLGLQLARIIAARTLVSIRRAALPEAHAKSQQLRKLGYVVIERLLDPTSYESVRNEFSVAIQSPSFITKRVIDTAGMLRTTCTITAMNAKYFPHTIANIRNSPEIVSLIKSYDGRASLDSEDSVIQLSFWRTELAKESHRHAETSDHTNTELHSDSFQSVIKCFYYLSDVTLESGAHIYAPRSHLLRFSRLVFEYLNSLIWMRESPRAGLAPRWLMRLEPVAFQYPANTAIISDTFGFHAAALPKPGHVRDIVYLQYRSHPFR